ncbi:Crp/Fnr family transcriptional regulator [Streptacidiphilus sp. PB12-B1b]|uniref:Crp/Fnr family transcriptional regulator n=1 Tax=Streptacidiphilus sp. PB12-B1b TaxID=2705012 RepID=UPI0015FBBD74|nr:Crp/Fnr family transcriptional regulator [Streptacidiphilus sp. PB12-B1b]QMU74567.1 Crp/Fnr family transcriptional regulator [Streptacidiphilus sp. PB12-B1b]
MTDPRTAPPVQEGSGATFWSWLGPDARDALVRAARPVRHQPGETLLRAGEHSDHLVVVRSGCVKVMLDSSTGHSAVLALRGPGDLLGEQAGIGGTTRSATLQALTDVTCWTLPLAEFSRLQLAEAGIGAALQRVLSERLREADRMRAATAEPVQTRLAALLLELAARYGSESDDGQARVHLPLSQDDLAGLVVSSRRTVSRVFEQWRQNGWVVTGRLEVRVLRVDVLRSLAFTTGQPS